MGYKEGADLGLNFMYPYQHFNRIKDHWRMPGVMAFMTSAVPGMIVSEEADDRLYHKLEAAGIWDEILQAASSHDAEPIFSALQLDVIETDMVSDPPTDAELDALFGGTPAEAGTGWHKFVRNIIYGNNYLIWSDGTAWIYAEGTAAL